MIKDDRAVLFIHVPKTGGSSIERLFTDSGWQMHFRGTRKTEPDLFRYYRCSPQHLHAAMLSELFALGRFQLSAAIVRDPLARFRSEFAMRHPDLEHGDAERVRVWTDEVMGRYQRNPYALDNHLRPQTDFLLPNTATYRLEDGLEAMVSDLNARFDLGLTAELSHRLRSGKKGLPSSAVDVPDDVVARLHEFYAADFEQLGYPAS
ncbi:MULTISPECIES: sulfotransferase family 2 domain-containing protein [unclassified Nocardioides]|uniref:sulfotransferase family 2 domain-containing protein n=1 Tax=unclassified Nocardioides TaxID=2615069 RepID=UPI001F483E7B|nr:MULTISPECIES: sulfotransferase family 2 domain-containing protein [unclassified Nocardioides]